MFLAKLKLYLQYLEGYCGNYVCSIIHEISHYVPAVIFYFLGLIDTFPKLEINGRFTITLRNPEDTGYYIMNVSMSVNYSQRIEYPIVNLIVTAMPAITTILLFWFSPWWLCLYYLSNISTLWLSVKDSRDIYHHLNLIKTRYFIKQLHNESSNPTSTETNTDN